MDTNSCFELYLDFKHQKMT